MSAIFFKLHDLVGDIKLKIIPSFIHRDLRWSLATFLLLYPLPPKKIIVYKKLKDKQKLSFLIRYLIGQAYKHKVPKQLLATHKEISDKKEMYTRFAKMDMDKYKLEKADDSADHIGTLFDVHEYTSKKAVLSNTLTLITTNIIDILYLKRVFLISNNFNEFTKRTEAFIKKFN